MKLHLLVSMSLACGLWAACDDVLEPAPPDAALRFQDASVASIRVSNVGVACSLLKPSCEGTDAECLEISYSGAFYPGGYCTADCSQSEECGDQGVCPVGDAQRVASDYRFRSTWARKCFRTCSPGTPGACRVGYACVSLAEVYLADDAPAPMHTPVCVPSWPTFSREDGGTPADAGAARTLDASL